MDIPDCWFFQNLRMAKGLADGGYLEPFLQKCGNYRVDDESSYELSWEGIASVFPNLRGYSNEEIEADILVLFDPLIDEFCRLCKLYEEKEGLPMERARFVYRSSVRSTEILICTVITTIMTSAFTTMDTGEAEWWC